MDWSASAKASATRAPSSFEWDMKCNEGLCGSRCSMTASEAVAVFISGIAAGTVNTAVGSGPSSISRFTRGRVPE